MSSLCNLRRCACLSAPAQSEANLEALALHPYFDGVKWMSNKNCADTMTISWRGMCKGVFLALGNFDIEAVELNAQYLGWLVIPARYRLPRFHQRDSAIEARALRLQRRPPVSKRLVRVAKPVI